MVPQILRPFRVDVSAELFLRNGISRKFQGLKLKFQGLKFKFQGLEFLSQTRGFVLGLHMLDIQAIKIFASERLAILVQGRTEGAVCKTC